MRSFTKLVSIHHREAAGRTTNQQNLDNMNFITYPYTNNYFNIGLDALQVSDSLCASHSDTILVVSLSQWSLQDVVLSSWMETLNSVQIVIVFHTQLLPLARYYQHKNENIIAICHESESLKVLGDFCRGRLVVQSDTEDYKPHLTEKEFISLRYLLDGVSAKEQAHIMGIGTKTAFAFRYNLTQKLQLKRLSHILFPFSQDILRCNVRASFSTKRKKYTT